MSEFEIVTILLVSAMVIGLILISVAGFNLERKPDPCASVCRYYEDWDTLYNKCICKTYENCKLTTEGNFCEVVEETIFIKIGD